MVKLESERLIIRDNIEYMAIIFDLYGTLVDFTNEDYLEQLCKMAYELQIDKDIFTYYWNIETHKQRMLGVYPTVVDNLKDICARLNINTDYKKIVKSANVSLEYSEKSLSQLRNNVECTLSELKNRNYKIGLISDCSPNVPQIWNTTILSKYFDKTIFSCNVNLKKPDSKIYQLLCKELNVHPTECYYVGDWSQELIGAYKVGMAPILICSKEDEEKDDSEQNDVNCVGKRIFDVKELLDIIG